MERTEHDRALEESVLVLAEALGLDLTKHTCLREIARLVSERRAADDWARREGERQAQQDRHDAALRRASAEAQEAADTARYGPLGRDGVRRRR
jgi:hypothetical protein